MKISAFFNLIRWKNLLLIALMQLFIKFFFLSGFGFQTLLTNSLFYLLVFTTLILTASGYMINDIIDLKTDEINKPNKVIIERNISILNAKRSYAICSFLGIITGTYISFQIERPIFSLYFVEISILLYLYSKLFKGTILIGNIVVSLLLAFSIIILLFFDTPIKLDSLSVKIQNVIILYAICAFLLNFIREIIKDIEDINGDYSERLKTLPIILGRKTARSFALVVSTITIVFFLFAIFTHLKIETLIFWFVFITIFLPLLYFTYKLWNATSKKEYLFLSKLLKIIILFGIISIPILSNYLKNVIE